MLNKSYNIDQVYNSVKDTTNQGYSKLSNFVSNDEVNILIGILENLFLENEKKYSGRIVEIKNINRAEFSILKKYKDIINKNLNSVLKTKFYLNKVWFERKIFNINTNENYKSELPYVPHIDKIRFFKALIYLQDTSEVNGAIKLGKQKPDDFETLRQKIINNKNVSNIVNNKTVTYNSINGKRGDIILFDTNNPHLAGDGEENKMRMTIRLDFENIHWNNNNLFSKIKFISKNALKLI